VDYNLLTTAGLVAGAGAVGAFWSHAKGFFSYVSGFLTIQKTLNNRMGEAVYTHLRRHYRKLPSGISTIRSKSLRVDGRAMASIVPFDMPNPAASIWWGRRGLLLVQGEGITLLGFRGLFNPTGLITDALEEYERARNETHQIEGGRFFIEKVLGTAGPQGHPEARMRANAPRPISGAGNDNDEGQVTETSYAKPNLQVDKSFMYRPAQYQTDSKKYDPLEGLFYPEEVLNMIEKVKRWHSMRDWYAERNIPWRTGILPYGPGGTGKSSLALALAKILGIPIYQYFLNTLTDKEFVDAWDNMNLPCVVALEDFDTVFHGREPVTIHKSLSFECVLNQISGISSLSGICLVVTTNHIDKIDPALGRLDEEGRPTRPGRIDHVLPMGNTTESQRRQIAAHTLRDWPHLIDDLVAQGQNTTAAQFQAQCIQAAVTHMAGLDTVNNVIEEQPMTRPSALPKLIDKELAYAECGAEEG